MTAAVSFSTHHHHQQSVKRTLRLSLDALAVLHRARPLARQTQTALGSQNFPGAHRLGTIPCDSQRHTLIYDNSFTQRHLVPQRR